MTYFNHESHVDNEGGARDIICKTEAKYKKRK